MKTKQIIVYVGKWNDDEYVFALTADEAKTLIENSFRFGDPISDPYAIGSEWASENDDKGWRVVAREIAIPIVPVEIAKSREADTAHVVWKCPWCSKHRSDEWLPSDKLPVLLKCGCEQGSVYLLGDVLAAN